MNRPMVKSDKPRRPKDLLNLRRGELKRYYRHKGVCEVEVHNCVENILAEQPRWSALELGKRIDLTFEKRRLLGIRTIQCVDRTPDEVKAYTRARKRERDRITKRKKRREMQRPADYMSVRARNLLAMLCGDWRRITDLAKVAKKRGPFRSAKGRNLKKEALRQALHRAVDELCNLALAEDKMDVGQHHERIRSVRKRRCGDEFSSP